MNEQDILKDFKGSLIIDSEGKILSAAGTLQEEFYNSQGFATTILSMLHDVNVITTSNKQEFKRMTITFSNQTFIVTIVGQKIFVVVQ
ncbi:hypothetical protein DICPUDRAFT_30947 [Dictyostelium purpureum]|uniref:Late endosomal/lysosomal adaptor and MAPK and MTOR activator 4 n=1 Tax=Dictyostelium purpureum TaxID=5786 RepID=F0ZGB3_DICPU|nr:uncharacterized protein DICPUDRAFT_30947 [Dictyostelium purpureum]EGC37032.1 hypothetical protein DICPUDRAFT_30947 [Dictyostelium purpureum]|eukprot:XP_003286460.1 hypothetical protein DICPUDRAFT_30947 [Dictyostelium purpureum]